MGKKFKLKWGRNCEKIEKKLVEEKGLRMGVRGLTKGKWTWDSGQAFFCLIWLQHPEIWGKSLSFTPLRTRASRDREGAGEFKIKITSGDLGLGGGSGLGVRGRGSGPGHRRVGHRLLPYNFLFLLVEKKNVLLRNRKI